MKTINQSVEIAFNAIDFSDALIILPLMDELVKSINNMQKAIDDYEAKEADKQMPCYIVDYKEKLPILIKRYNILHNIGFVSSIPLIETVKLS